MSKRILVLALSLMATVMLASNLYGQACSSGVDVVYNGIGSSAQFNTLAFGANDALSAVSGYTAPTNYWASSSSQVIDARTGVNTIDAGLKTWVFYDSAATCHVYVGWSADSVQGTKDFFCYGAVPTGLVGVVADCYGNHETTNSWELASCTASVVPGIACTGTTLPTTLSTFLVTQPNPTKTGTVQSLPATYCGGTETVASATSRYCYFNAAHTDIRPEDGLFASTRALSSYNTTNGYSGLGYNQTACGATGTGAKTVGCPIYDSFDQGKVFYPLNFAISGNDPYTAKAVPAFTTIPLGLSPVIVFVNNQSTGTLGFGSTSGGNYVFTNINRTVLGNVFGGTDSCTGDLLTSNTFQGAGSPIQVVLREPLSGTYNTFEFTGVKTLTASAIVGITEHTASATSWVSADESGQEFDPYENLTAGPATNASTCDSSAPPSATCGDPLYNQTGTCGTGTTTGLKLRAIGTGEEIKAGLAGYNSVTGNPQISNGIAYAFWGYSNFKGGASGCTGSGTSGDVTCSTYVGHYLTVDGVDGLFDSPGGSVGSENPTGAYQFPQCGFIQGVSGYTYPCAQIPFTHIYDGSYPLWSQLRIVTFTKGTNQVVPSGVVAVVANAETEAASGSAEQLSDFVPFFSGINTTVTPPTGNLNVGVFRSHYLQSKVDPSNGHASSVCSSFESSTPYFQGIALDNSTGCLVDAGGDVGGSILTVQSDVDFNADAGSLLGGLTPQLYGLHQ
jgi:hypothetical protein